MTQDNKPNILFVPMDNLGYGELGVYGGGILRGAPTPNIDQLAGEGTRLLNFNVEAQCTPTRSAFMTGPLLHSLRHLRSPDRRRPRRVDAVGSHHREVASGPRLRHGHVGQVASRQR